MSKIVKLGKPEGSSTGSLRVANAFIAGRAYNESNMLTCGNTVYSYCMPIAVRIPGKGIFVCRREDSLSVTTTKHINAVTAVLSSYVTLTAEEIAEMV